MPGDDEFRLESILSEYKGEAFIAGDRKTRKDLLEEQTEQILTEEKRAGEEIEAAQIEEKPEEAPEMPEEVQEAPEEPEEAPEISVSQFDDMDAVEKEFFGPDKYSGNGELHELVSKAEQDTLSEKKKRKKAGNLIDFAKAKKREEKQKAEQESEENEISFDEAEKLYASGISSASLRGTVSAIICIAMVYFVFALSHSLPLPQAIAADFRMISGISVLLQLCVMLLCSDIFAKGAADILTLHFSAESLSSVACIASLLQAVDIWVSGKEEIPYCAVAAVSMFFALLGSRFTKEAFRYTLRAASASAEPYYVLCEYGKLDEGSVISKTEKETAGFMNRLEEKDVAAEVYSRAVPLIIAAEAVFALLASVGQGRGEEFLRCFAAVSAAGASFASCLTFAMPFKLTAKRLAEMGAAVAGWRGAADIGETRGLVIRDEEIFPSGTVEISGVKIFPQFPAEKVISYTGSMLKLYGGGMEKLFAQLVRGTGGKIFDVGNSNMYENGISAMINGERVTAGSAAFMNLMGVELPAGLTVGTAVYTAINGELAGVFTMDYTPINSVQNALLILFRAKASVLFAVRDFNITPLLIRQKFKISTDNIEMMTVKERFKLSEEGEGDCGASAMICREGLAPLCEVAAGGRLMRSSVIKNLIIALAGIAIGMILVYFCCAGAHYDAVSVRNLLTYMFLWVVPVLLISGSAAKY